MPNTNIDGARFTNGKTRGRATATARPPDGNKQSTDTGAMRRTAAAAAAAAPEAAGSGARRPSHMSTSLLAEGIDPVVRELDYYHGLTPRDDVEPMMKRPGDYLLRKTDALPPADSTGAQQQHEAKTKRQRMMVISVMAKDKSTKHYPIIKNAHGKYAVTGNAFYFANVKDLIESYRQNRMPLSNDGPTLVAAIKRQPWQLTREQIRLHERAGAGAFGEVYHGTVLTTDGGATECAVKIAVDAMAAAGSASAGSNASGMSNASGDANAPALPPFQPMTKEQQQAFLKEASMLRKLKHDNVIAMYGVACQEEPVMIVMEYAAGGNLHAYLKKNKLKLRLIHRLKICHDASKGMAYLERKSLVHRDVAARNCLLTGTEIDVKISDFGLALRRLDEVKEIRHTTAVRMAIKWMAPECLTSGIFSSKSDVWSFGVLVWEVFADGAEPYAGYSNLEVKAKLTTPPYAATFRMQMPTGTPPAICKAVAQMWSLKPDERPTFKAIEKTIGKTIKDYEHSCSNPVR